jgi:predicted aconitase with swiveling domain
MGNDRDTGQGMDGGDGRAALAATCLVPGHGDGPALALAQPLSFWGGYDAAAGRIVEPGHPQCGASLGGTVMLMERAKGSSSSSSVLAEAIRNGTGPTAIVMLERDLIVALGCIVASELYGVDVPLAMVDADAWQRLLALPAGTRLRVQASMDACRVELA